MSNYILFSPSCILSFLQLNRQNIDSFRSSYTDLKSHSIGFYAAFTVREKVFGASRAEVFDRLAENGIGARKYFYPLTNTFSCFHRQYDVNETPVALHISKRVLTLPLYADLSMEDVDHICEIVLACRM